MLHLPLQFNCYQKSKRNAHVALFSHGTVQNHVQQRKATFAITVVCFGGRSNAAAIRQILTGEGDGCPKRLQENCQVISIEKII